MEVIDHRLAEASAAPESIVRLVDLGPVVLIEVNGPRRYLVEHLCKSFTYDDEPGVRHDIYACPHLDPAHVIVAADPLTITPSILCPDCGLHGFVTGGVWNGC